MHPARCPPTVAGSSVRPAQLIRIVLPLVPRAARLVANVPSPVLVQCGDMSSVVTDLRYAARELRRRPGFALTAVLSLALGIGATSAVFSVIYGVLINPFPYVGADRMMQLALMDNAGGFRYPGMTGAQLDQLRQARTVESVVGEDGWNLTTTDGDIPECLRVCTSLQARPTTGVSRP